MAMQSVKHSVRLNGVNRYWTDKHAWERLRHAHREREIETQREIESCTLREGERLKHREREREIETHGERERD
jgi:hypothetical protein